MINAQIHYSVTDKDEILVQLETGEAKITLVSTEIIENATDFTIEISTTHKDTGGPDLINVRPKVVGSDAVNSKIMIIDWFSTEDEDDDDDKKKKKRVKRRRTSTTVANELS